MWTVLKRLRSHCKTIVEMEQNVNLLLAATVALRRTFCMKCVLSQVLSSKCKDLYSTCI